MWKTDQEGPRAKEKQWGAYCGTEDHSLFSGAASVLKGFILRGADHFAPCIPHLVSVGVLL